MTMKGSAALLLAGGAVVQGFAPGMMIPNSCGISSARGISGVGASGALLGRESLTLRAPGGRVDGGRNLVRLEAAKKKGGGGKGKGTGKGKAQGGGAGAAPGKPAAAPGAGLDAAKAAAMAAENMNLLDDGEDDVVVAKEDEVEKVVVDKKMSAAEEARFDATSERISKFEDAINVERQRKISVPKSGMDGRGMSQGGLYGRGKAEVEEEEEEEEEETAFDDSNIKSLLQGKKEKKKSKKEERAERMVKTETGEELLLEEFAPGATLSSFARPEGMPEEFDPMNMPLPSELAARKQESITDPDGFFPLPSEVGTSSQVNLYNDIASGVEDESLFRIKSNFDAEGGAAPGKSDIPASTGFSSSKQKAAAAMGDMMPADTGFRAPREPLVGIVNDEDDDDEDVSGLQKLNRAAGGIGEAVNRGISTIVAFDFFAVLFFLGWLVVSIVYQFAVCKGLTPESGPVCDNPIYTQWYALWTPVIQPLLGILFAGTIAQATINGITGVGKDDQRR